eukprot:TRINITY_DN3152_c0_g1_i1.p1 TRINITY_DN3152_c0_g1~~TRINITY_DN3152_c0_g1_i1.p1  ORF type:complete len:184 (+),score=30.59 TRINITY_DN3152_c0_g1_i1:346-897(+)
MTILTTGFAERAKPLSDWDLSKPTAVILSNEHSGIRPELEAVADGEVYIPMMGMVPSFNVSVAAALVLYEAFRQRMAKGMYDSPTLSPEEMESLFETWSNRQASSAGRSMGDGIVLCASQTVGFVSFLFMPLASCASVAFFKSSDIIDMSRMTVHKNRRAAESAEASREINFSGAAILRKKSS